MKAIDLAGKRFGRLLVTHRAGTYISPSGNQSPLWACQCSCGKRVSVRYGSLASGGTGSCGCLIREKLKSGLRTTHGHSRRNHHSAEYKVWASMMARCYSSRPGDSSYSRYRGAGITVCLRWHDFAKFFSDMGKRPFLRATIDRRNGARGYSPSNCRWATYREQANNTRRNVWITFNGKTQTVAQWSEETGLAYSAIKNRLGRLKWSPERALTEPSQVGRRRVA